MTCRPIGSAAVAIALAALGANGLASCGFSDINILPGSTPVTFDLPEQPMPPPPTSEQIRGTACETGDWPAPDCLRYRSRPMDELCRGPHAVNFQDDCETLRTDLPLPPGSRERRPLLPPN